jgi:hypothetical protein
MTSTPGRSAKVTAQMKVLEALGVKGAEAAACVTAHDYLSERSVALLLRPRPDQLDIGSAVAIEIGGHRLLATAAHNIRGLDPTQIEPLPAGRRLATHIPIRSARVHPLAEKENVDVAWLEIDPSVANLDLSFVRLDQIIRSAPTEDRLPCLVQGFPAETVDKPLTISAIPLVESDGLLTLTIAAHRRQSVHRPDVDLGVEYPPHDGSLDGAGLPAPPGASGGGFWLFPRFENDRIWSPEAFKLIGIARGWWKADREFLATRIDRWITLVAEDFPDTRPSIKDVLGIEF